MSCSSAAASANGRPTVLCFLFLHLFIRPFAQLSTSKKYNAAGRILVFAIPHSIWTEAILLMMAMMIVSCDNGQVSCSSNKYRYFNYAVQWMNSRSIEFS